MKLLLVVSLFLVVGCGADTQTEFEFYNEYFAECVTMCSHCAVAIKDCSAGNYDADLCTQQHWYRGTSNLACRNASSIIVADGICSKLEEMWECSEALLD